MKKISKSSILLFSLALFFLLSGHASAAPYAQSSLVSGINWDTSTLKRTAYGSDNFPTTWSNDDFIYTLYQDGCGFQGNINGICSDICGVDLGVARISGSGTSPSYDDYWGHGGSCSNYTATFGGKSYGIVSVGGTLHMLVGGKSGMIQDANFLAPGGWGGSCWDAMSVTRIASSYDHGASWSLTGSDFFSYQKGVGYPSFLQYGKDYAGNTDGYIYVYSSDVSGGENGRATKVTLLRVPKGEVRTAGSYRYYTGTSWSSNSSDRQSIFTDTTNGVGLPTAIYHSGLGRYILVVPHGTPKGTCLGGSGEGGLGIFEGPNPWGPWKTIYYKDNWMGSNKMFYANIPTKWISGNDFYLIFTGHNPDPIAEDAYQHMKGTFTLTSTPVPAATLTLTANPTSRIGAGSSVLTWTTNNATSCWASGGASGDGWYNSWKTATNGAHTLSVSVPSTRTYSLECWNSAGTSSGIKSVTVTINAPASCTLPWGGSIASGASVTAYSTSSVACGSSCASQTRTCTNGTLSGTYTNQNCSVAACPANTPPSASITTPSSDGTSVAKGSALNFSGSIADSDNSSLTYGWYIDRIGDGLADALIKQGTQASGTTSGSIIMTGTKTNIANPSQAISLDTVGATYNLILKVSDGTNTEVQTIRSFTLTNSAPADFCGDGTCNGTEICSTCPGDCGACPKTYNLTDFTKLVTDWLKSMTGSPADVNSDGKVNSQDLGIMMSNWAL